MVTQVLLLQLTPSLCSVHHWRCGAAPFADTFAFVAFIAGAAAAAPLAVAIAFSAFIAGAAAAFY